MAIGFTGFSLGCGPGEPAALVAARRICGALPGGQVPATRTTGPGIPGGPGGQDVSQRPIKEHRRSRSQGRWPRLGERSVAARGRAEREPGCGNRGSGASWPSRDKGQTAGLRRHRRTGRDLMHPGRTEPGVFAAGRWCSGPPPVPARPDAMMLNVTGEHAPWMTGKQPTSLIGAAGEHYVMSQLLLRGGLAALTPRGAPDADILVASSDGSIQAEIQVKARSGRSGKGWPMSEKHEHDHPGPAVRTASSTSATTVNGRCTSCLPASSRRTWPRCTPRTWQPLACKASSTRTGPGDSSVRTCHKRDGWTNTGNAGT